jgi:hypothetical protein
MHREGVVLCIGSNGMGLGTIGRAEMWSLQDTGKCPGSPLSCSFSQSGMGVRRCKGRVRAGAQGRNQWRLLCFAAIQVQPTFSKECLRS